MFCNAGSTFTNMKGMFGSILVVYNPHGIANIVPLKNVKMIRRDLHGVFKVYAEAGRVALLFNHNGLNYLNLAQQDNTAIMFVTTIKQNFEGYSQKEIQDAIKARRLHVV